jgi:hypothetical protein
MMTSVPTEKGGVKVSSKKLRIGGVTVQANETYSGATVLHLVEVSFTNGKRQGEGSSQEAFNRGYAKGFEAGSRNACETLQKLREVLHEVLEVDAN